MPACSLTTETVGVAILGNHCRQIAGDSLALARGDIQKHLICVLLTSFQKRAELNWIAKEEA